MMSKPQGFAQLTINVETERRGWLTKAVTVDYVFFLIF